VRWWRWRVWRRRRELKARCIRLPSKWHPRKDDQNYSTYQKLSVKVRKRLSLEANLVVLRLNWVCPVLSFPEHAFKPIVAAPAAMCTVAMKCMFSSLVHLMLSFNISYPYSIEKKFMTLRTTAPPRRGWWSSSSGSLGCCCCCYARNVSSTTCEVVLHISLECNVGIPKFGLRFCCASQMSL
jgi:hypothetical protein